MKFGYEGKQDKDIIKNFDKADDKIIINFLDGHTIELLLNDKNEEELLITMFNQANERNLSDTAEEIKDLRKHYLMYEIISISMCSSNCMNIIKHKIQGDRTFIILYSLLSLSFVIIAIINGKGYKIYNDKLKELKKYAIYIDLVDKLKKVEDINGNNILKINNINIDINNLDNYTLKEIRKLRDSIKNNINYTKYFDEKESYSSLIKKLIK